MARSALAGAVAQKPADWRLVAELQTELVYDLLAQERGLEAEPLVRELVDVQRGHPARSIRTF